MGEIPGNSSLFTSLSGAAQYHYDVVESLKRYFSPELPHSLPGVDTYPGPRVVVRPSDYFEETGLRSSLAMLTSIEAAFRQDYEVRCRRRLKDELSRDFCTIYKRKQFSVSLEKDLFDAWAKHEPQEHQLIGDLSGAFRFRHWLAHGRYWPPKLGRKYDFDYLYRLAEAVYSKLQLRGLEDV
jgi:hypothetical protein